MIKKRLTLFFFLSLVFLPSLSRAMDFGLILDQSPEFGGAGKETAFGYTGILTPRVSALLGNRSEFHISAGFRADYLNENWTFMPELLRTELSLRFGSGQFVAGRMLYSDPLAFIAEGLFDGARFSLDTAGGTFSAGAWYTGLLYKKRINITMTDEELISNGADPDYEDFFNTYFAPRRIVSALDWEHPALGERLRIKFSLLGQYDISGADLHSQYAALKLSLPVKNFIFDLGGCVELIEEKNEFLGIGLAGEMGIVWMLPTAIEDRLSFLGRFSSGVIEGGQIIAFQPLVTKAQGEILEARFSGISTLSLDYIARLHRTFSLGLTSTYFVRSDLGTFTGFVGEDEYFLGNEFCGRLLWSPSSDIQLNLGGGAFMPSLGNVAPDAQTVWRVELNVILSLY